MPRTRWRCWRVLATALLVACARPVLADLDTEIEEGLGNWMAQAFIAQRGRFDEPPIHDWVARVGRQLLEHTSGRELDYRFVVLDSPEANGFALPGGWVFITAGLLESMESEDELAAVLAHELGHHANRDFQEVALRTALWLGLAEVLRNNDARDWVPLVQAAQLVETLSNSRQREAGADAFGARLAWDAGYDPRAMAAFLGDEPKWSYLQTIFATHPHPTRRSDWIREEFAQLRSDDPDGALDLARSLIDRGRYAHAEAMLNEPLAGEYEAERAALLARIAERHDEVARDDGVGLPAERAAAVEAAVAAASEARADAEETRELAWTRLRRLWRDRQVENGLIVAQAIDPEVGNPGYLLLLAQSVNVLHRSMRGANLVARTLGMRREAADGLDALADALPAVSVEPARADALSSQAQATTARAEASAARAESEAAELARLAGQYHQAARLVAPLLVELALSGEGDPAERLTFARFLLIEARVEMLDERVRRLDRSLDQIAEAAWRATVDTYRLRLNVAALGATDMAREAIFSTVARRVGAERGAVVRAWEDGTLPGDRVLELLGESMRPCGDTFGRDLRATQILIRIAFVEVKEQVAWAAKEKSALEGAGTLAIRGAVRHPQ